MIRRIRFVPALVALGVLAACSSDRATGIDGICDVTNPVSSITVNPPSATLFLRSAPRASDAIQLEPTAYGRFGAARSDIAFAYNSSNSAVATVNDSGVVTAQAIGNATITISACDDDASVNIAVVSELESISVALASDTIAVGDSVLVTAQATATGGGVLNGAVFTWTTDPASVASVTALDDTTAVVHALTEGSVLVGASIDATTGSAELVVIPAATP